MIYLGPKVMGNFRTKSPKKPRAATRRDGMSTQHLKLIRQLPSCLSGRNPCVAHHLLSVPADVPRERGVGLKATDRWALPLTWEEHERLHRECGSKTEEEWFLRQGVQPHLLARALWNATGDLEKMTRIVRGRTKFSEQCPVCKELYEDVRTCGCGYDEG